jgi:DNA-binding transcriptional regulator YhcF (GntR family)
MLPDLPPHRQIAAYLKVHVSLGKISPGTPMPDPRALAYRLRAPRAEVRRAYRDLAERGYVSPSRRDASWVVSDERSAIRDADLVTEIGGRFRDLVLQARRAGLTRVEIRRMVDRLVRRS